MANLVTAPHRFTRDIDLLRRHGPPDPDEMRRRFRDIAAVPADDGLRIDPADVRATFASRETEGYDGVRVVVRAHLGDTEVVIQIDIGFGDAVEPPAERRRLSSFLDEDPSAEVYAYETGPVLAEKIETLIAKFPAIEHRLKDLLDVVVLARQEHFLGKTSSRRSGPRSHAARRRPTSRSSTSSSPSSAGGDGPRGGLSGAVRRLCRFPRISPRHWSYSTHSCDHSSRRSGARRLPGTGHREGLGPSGAAPADERHAWPRHATRLTTRVNPHPTP